MLFDKARAFAPAVTGIMVKGSGAFASFLLTFVIARTLGAVETGYYALASATMTTAALVTLGGLDQLLVRTMAGDLREGRSDRANSALRQVAFWAIVNGAIAAIILAILLPFSPRIGMPRAYVAPVAVAVLVFPALRTISAALRATGKRVLALAFDGPIFTGFTGLVALVTFLVGVKFSALTFVWILSGAIYASILIAFLTLRSRIARWPQVSEKRYPSLIGASWPIFLSAVAQVLTDWLLLAQVGAMAVPGEVGAYRVAFQIVSILALMVATIENLVAPGFAGDLRLNDIPRAKQRHRRASLGLLAVVGIPSLLAFILAKPMLSIFGSDFLRASDALRVLLAAQLVNAFTGPVGVFLIMAKRERSTVVLSYVALVVSILVGVILIPIWGATGAATAYLLAIVIRNAGAYFIFTRVKEVKNHER